MADQSTFGSGIMVISLLIELSIGSKHYSLPLFAYLVNMANMVHILTI